MGSLAAAQLTHSCALDWAGSEKSKEETACLKKLLARRPRRAHQHQHLNPRRIQDLVRFGRVDGPQAVLAAGLPAVLGAAASSFAARRCASSAPRRSTPFLTAMFVCCKDLWLSAGRLCLAGSPVFARPTSAALRAQSSRLGTSPCCRLQPGTSRWLSLRLPMAN